MIVNEGDTVKVDGYWKANVEGTLGTVIRADYERERSLVDSGKKIFWIRNDCLKVVKHFFEGGNNETFDFTVVNGLVC